MHDNSSVVSKETVNRIRHRRILILVFSIIICIALAAGALYMAAEQRREKEREKRWNEDVSIVAQSAADWFNSGFERSSFSVQAIGKANDPLVVPLIYQLSYSGSYDGEIDVYGNYEDGELTVGAADIYINNPNGEVLDAAKLYALGLKLFFNVDLSAEEEISEKMIYTEGWDNTDMYFYSQDEYPVTLCLGVYSNGSWCGSMWIGL